MKHVLLRKSRGHTSDKGCQKEYIQEIAESCDNEYYMSACGPEIGDRERALRGLHRIREWIGELEKLAEEVLCHECQKEIMRQIHIQEGAIIEIENLWAINDQSQ